MPRVYSTDETHEVKQPIEEQRDLQRDHGAEVEDEHQRDADDPQQNLKVAHHFPRYILLGTPMAETTPR